MYPWPVYDSGAVLVSCSMGSSLVGVVDWIPIRRTSSARQRATTSSVRQRHGPKIPKSERPDQQTGRRIFGDLLVSDPFSASVVLCRGVGVHGLTPDTCLGGK